MHGREWEPTDLDQADVWDALVVGAGPAGCAAAYDLAAAGWRVLLVDTAAFPRPKACAGGLTRKALRALRYPLDPVVRRWVASMVLEKGEESAITVGRKAAVCAMTVRAELDAFCLERTIERGARFERVARVLGLEGDGGSGGVTLRFEGGREIQARYVIGADGVHSQMRRLVMTRQGPAGWFRRAFAVEANVAYRDGEEAIPLTFDFAPVRGGYGWVFPRDTHVNVGLYVEECARGSLEDERGVPPGSPVNVAALERYIAARCGPERTMSRPVGQFLGLGAENYRPTMGSRAFLAGDAAGFVDPLTGEGIYGAIRSGQVAAAAVDAGLCAEQHGLPGAAAAGLAYEAAVAPLHGDLKLARRAADRFYAEPARGFALMRLPLVSRTVLRVYGDGMPLTWLMRGLRGMAHLQRLGRYGVRKG